MKLAAPPLPPLTEADIGAMKPLTEADIGAMKPLTEADIGAMKAIARALGEQVAKGWMQGKPPAGNRGNYRKNEHDEHSTTPTKSKA